MSARALSRLFLRLVAASGSLAALGVAAASGCSESGSGLSGPDYPRCEPQSYVSHESYECPALTPEQMTAMGIDAGAEDAGTESARAGDVGAPRGGGTCEERCQWQARGEKCVVREPEPGVCVADCTIEGMHPCGRRPAGLTREEPQQGEERAALGAYLAASARLEAASVIAFEALAGELAAHGAPAGLVRAARRSARDEERHTRAMARLASRFGGEFVVPRVKRRRERSLRAMAIENVVEGCVRETYGALLATYQAEHAADPRVRRAMRAIAADETAHAALAWSVAAWAEGRLDERAARAVRSSMRAAGRALLRDVSAPPPAPLATTLGLPDAEDATRLARGLLNELKVG
jgi:hypothetical protein